MSAQQTSYSRAFSGPFSGQLGDTGFSRVASWFNDASAAIPAGLGMVKTTQGLAGLPSDGTTPLCGISLNSFSHDPNDLTGSQAIQDNTSFNMLEEGAAYVQTEQTVTTEDPVYVRFTSDGGSNTQTGRFRKDGDSGRARFVKGARWLTGATAAGAAQVYFSASAEKADASSIGLKKISLTAAAESEGAETIAVTGQVSDLAGTALTAAVEVMVRSLSSTANEGDIVTTTGTERLNAAPATGENLAWITTDATGAFAFTVHGAASDVVLVSASSDKAFHANLKCTFDA